MHLCVCGRKFSEPKNLRRHEHACRILKEHHRRIHAIIFNAVSNNNWQHPDIDSEGQADDSSSLFMGITRRRKKSKKSASINDTVGQEVRDAPDMGLGDNTVMVRCAIIERSE